MSVDVKVPSLGESVSTAFVSRWLKQVGEPVNAGEGIVELDSDKANLEVPAPASGVLGAQLAAKGDEVQIGAVIARIDEAGAAVAPVVVAPAVVAEPVAEPAAEPAAGRGPQTGPAVRHQAAALGVDLSQVSGSGVRGRVLRRDVEAAAEAPVPVAAPTPVLAPVAAPVPVPAPVAAVPVSSDPRAERVPLTPLRRTIARRLVEAQHTAAMLTTFNEVDMTAIQELRKRYGESFLEKYGVKLGFMSFFVKAAVEALKAFPMANAELDGDALVYKRYYNVGVAVSAPRGLVVPVVRDADRLGFAETEVAIGALGKKAKDNKLSPDDFKDGTFTISNGGVFGSLMSTPILNPPQVAILGMHAIQERPVGLNGQIVLRPMMYLALSYDHRVLDGREAVGFLVKIKQLVEAPERILLEI